MEESEGERRKEEKGEEGRGGGSGSVGREEADAVRSL